MERFVGCAAGLVVGARVGDVTADRTVSSDGRLEFVGVRRSDDGRGEAMVDMAAMGEGDDRSGLGQILSCWYIRRQLRTTYVYYPRYVLVWNSKLR